MKCKSVQLSPQVNTGKENESFVDAMVSLRERILHCWKEMRRTFRSSDPGAEGYVPAPMFRQVLIYLQCFIFFM